MPPTQPTVSLHRCSPSYPQAPPRTPELQERNEKTHTPRPSPPCSSGETEGPGGEGHAESQHGSRASSWPAPSLPACLERQELPGEQLIGLAHLGSPKEKAAL